MIYSFNPAEDLPPTRFLNEPIRDRLLKPSLLDPQFRRSVGGVTIYLANDIDVPNDASGMEVEGVDYHYSTGMIEARVKSGDITQAQLNKAHSSARFHAGLRTDTAAYHEFYIQRVVDNRALHLQHLIANVSRITGRPFFIYGTTVEKTEE